MLHFWYVHTALDPPFAPALLHSMAYTSKRLFTHSTLARQVAATAQAHYHRNGLVTVLYSASCVVLVLNTVKLTLNAAWAQCRLKGAVQSERVRLHALC